jgi:2-keto-3-deoxy-L-rhamnonate aldolase RhmA
MDPSRLKRELSAGRPVVGCVLSVPDPFVIELLGQADFDFLLIDMQHAPIGVETLQTLLVSLASSRSSVIVRAAWNDPVYVNQILDLGADGIVIPMVNRREDAELAAWASRYPPAGGRSWGPRRASRIHGGPDAYARGANDQVMLLPQIETREAVANIDDILSVPGIDGIMIGPADLANSMGFHLDRDNTTVERAVTTVLERCRAHGVPFGHFTGTIEKAKYWIERGALIAIAGSDTGFLADGVARTIAGVKEIQPSPFDVDRDRSAARGRA